MSRMSSRICLLILFIVAAVLGTSQPAGFSKSYAQTTTYATECIEWAPTQPADPTNSSAQWQHPAPGLWTYVEVNAVGLYTREHYHFAGLVGYVSALRLVVEPRIKETKAQLLFDPKSPLVALDLDWLYKMEKELTESIAYAQEIGALGAAQNTQECDPEEENWAVAEAHSVIDHHLLHLWAYASNNTEWPAVTNWYADMAPPYPIQKGEKKRDDVSEFDYWFNQPTQHTGTDCYGWASATSRYGHFGWEVESDFDKSSDGNCSNRE